MTDVLGVLATLEGLPAMAGRCMDDIFNHMLVAVGVLSFGGERLLTPM